LGRGAAEDGGGGCAEESGGRACGKGADVTVAGPIGAVGAAVGNGDGGAGGNGCGEREANGGAVGAERGAKAAGVNPFTVHQHREAVDAGEGGGESLGEAQGHGNAVDGELEEGGNGHGWGRRRVGA